MIATTLFRNSAEFFSFDPGSEVFRAGDEGRVMFAVIEGEVDIVVAGQVMESVGPGGVIGEMALIEHKPRAASAVARTACKLSPIDEKRFMFLVSNTPHFALQLLRVMADRLRRTNEKVAQKAA